MFNTNWITNRDSLKGPMEVFHVTVRNLANDRRRDLWMTKWVLSQLLQFS